MTFLTLGRNLIGNWEEQRKACAGICAGSLVIRCRYEDRDFEGQERENELQDRIRAGGEALRAAGCSPCDEEAFKSWRATWVPMASHLRSDDGEFPRA